MRLCFTAGAVDFSFVWQQNLMLCVCSNSNGQGGEAVANMQGPGEVT